MYEAEEHSKISCCDDRRLSFLKNGRYRERNCTKSGEHRSKQCPGIVIVNRQIYNECVSILQKITDFRFGTLPCLRTFLENLTDNYRSLITKLSVRTTIAVDGIWYHSHYDEKDGPISEFVSNTRATFEYFSRRGWSRILAVDTFWDDDEVIVFTLSTTKTSEEDRRKNLEDGLLEDDCKIYVGGIDCSWISGGGAG